MIVENNIVQDKVTIIKGISIFLIFTLYFCFLLYCILPIIKSNIVFNNAIIYWLVIGYLLFTPLLLCSIILVIIEGNKNVKKILSSLCIKPFSKKDWKYSVIGLLFVFIFSGIIYGGSIILNRICEVPLLETKVWFMEIQPLNGLDKLIVLLWLPMFLLNIFGEELLWRGYIQSRLKNEQMWFVYSIMWFLFHLLFGIDLVIMLIPIMVIVPYIFSKQKNTLIGCFIHGLFNGPIFLLVILGILK
jgi:membrane protease YdiL (CAAX protease family)